MNVYCVQSGFHIQVLNRILKESLGNKKGIMFVKGNKRACPLNGFKNNNIKVVYADGNFLLFLFLLLRLFSFLFERFYISDLKSVYYQFLMSGLKKSKIIAFDDGASSINLLGLYIRNKSIPNLNGAESFSNWKRAFFRVFNVQLENVDFCFKYFYTIFPFKHDSIKNVSFNESEFDDKLIDYNSAVFLGGPYLEKKIITRDTYNNALQGFVKANSDKSLYYIPHRSESLEMLNIIKLKFPKIKILRTDLAVELFYLEQKHVPISFYSLYSTALFTLPMYFRGIKCYSRFIETERIKEEHREAISATYNLLKISRHVTFY